MLVNSDDARVLGPRVHTRLFNKHISEAKPYVESSARTNGANGSNVLPVQRSVLNTCSNAMVFSRVRAIGAIVCQENADIEGANCRFIYIDDGTGVVAFTLNNSCKSEEQVITEDLEQRLLLASQAHRTLNGITVEVMGKLCHRETVCTMSNSNTEASKLPRVWIECSHLTVKDDAMAETAASFDTIATYQFLFPKGFGKTTND